MADDRADAKEVAKVASRHTAQCFIGRDNQRPDRRDYIVQYWKGDSNLSVAQPSDADCIGYDPASLRIVDEGARGFLLTDGQSRMLMLDDRDDGRRALQLARQHARHCFIGRDNQRPDRKRYITEYWRP